METGSAFTGLFVVMKAPDLAGASLEKEESVSVQ